MMMSNNIMNLPKHIIKLLLIVFISSYSCYSNSTQDPISNYLDNKPSSSAYDSSAYGTYFRTIDEDDHHETHPNFPNMIKYNSQSSIVDENELVGSHSSSHRVVNVNHYGAKGDGSHDDTEAFKKAWREACSSLTGAILLVPQSKTYLLNTIEFLGPCKSQLTMKVYGTIEASANRDDYKQDPRHWLLFNNIQNLRIEGGGTFNGKGEIWWKNSCKINKSLPCITAPTAITFYKCQNMRLKNLRIIDAQQIHVSFEQSSNIEALNLLITAPERSPNTDGIHIAGTHKIQIKSCVIRTGDDCISIVDGSQSVHAKDITCGPGHGISIGSLGEDKSEAHVSDVVVDTATLSGTTNGVRIKTWQGGSGDARKIIFQNILMRNVSNPIIIDQNYCDQKDPCNEQESSVHVYDVLYKNIEGTSASDVAMSFDCSKSYPCRGIVLEDINLVRQQGKEAKAVCNNVKLTKIGKITPRCPAKN